jgi:ketosteroid isomerase-like protein
MNRGAAVILALLGVIGSPGPRAAENETFEDAQVVARALHDLMDAAARKDLDRVESFHLYGPAFSKFSETGLGRQDAETAREAERRGLSAARSFQAKIEGLKVDLFGPVAVATMILHYAVATEGVEATGATRSTIVLVQVDSQWKIVHEHHSSLHGEG